MSVYRENSHWLEAILVDAQEDRLCTDSFCTTCGCLEFRRTYWAAAARQAGIAGSFESARMPKDIFEGVSVTEHRVLVQTLIAGLRELSPMWTASEAFRVIIIDLDPPLLKHGIPMVLDKELSGTPAGEALRQMRAYDAEERAQFDRRSAYESPQAVAERKRVRRVEKTAAQPRRQQEKRQRDLKRSEMLGYLARLSPTDRLARFATDRRLNLDSVPAELIPTHGIDLEKSLVEELLARIDRRRGPWGRLRRMFENRVKDGSE
jgi:hypothetical protein